MSDLTQNPYDLPEFATDDLIDSLTGQNNVVEPVPGDKQFGWYPFRRRPSRNNMNWLHRLTYNSLDWLKNTFYSEVNERFSDLDIFHSAYRAGVYMGKGAIAVNSTNKDRLEFNANRIGAVVENKSNATDKILIPVAGASTFYKTNANTFTEGSTGGLKAYSTPLANQWVYLFIVYDGVSKIDFATDTDPTGANVKNLAICQYLRLLCPLPYLATDNFINLVYGADDFIEYGPEETIQTPTSVGSTSGSFSNLNLKLFSQPVLNALPPGFCTAKLMLKGVSAGTQPMVVRGKWGVSYDGNNIFLLANDFETYIHELESFDSEIEYKSNVDTVQAYFSYLLLGYKNPVVL